MILLLDNYDSFTYNLAHILYALHDDVVVRRNREITVEEALKMRPEAIILSPGPGRPENAGIMPELIQAVYQETPLFGVCLGHQAIGQAFGAEVISAKTIMHGKCSNINHDGKGIFANINNHFRAVRYHSLAIGESTLPAELEVSARSEDGEIMGVRHREYLIEGIQYHPESILTTSGKKQLTNFIEMVAKTPRRGR